MPAARTGSPARKAISQAPCAKASNTLPAASKVTNSTGTPRRLARSRASSVDTPRGSPLAGSFCASTTLPKLIAARSLPVGASSVTTLRGIVSAMAPDMQAKSRDNRRAGEASALIIERSLEMRDYPSLLALQGRLPTLIPCQFHRRANDGQDRADQSRGYFQAVFKLLARSDRRGGAEARVLVTPCRLITLRAVSSMFAGLKCTLNPGIMPPRYAPSRLVG